MPPFFFLPLALVRALPPGFRGFAATTARQGELHAGIAAFRKSRGRPAGSGTKEQVAIRFDKDVLATFRASGPGWQTRINNALRDWLKTHSSA